MDDNGNVSLKTYIHQSQEEYFGVPLGLVSTAKINKATPHTFYIYYHGLQEIPPPFPANLSDTMVSVHTV